MGMRITRIMLFVFLVNLVLAVLYEMHIFSWGAGAAVDVAAFNWKHYAGLMIGVGLIAGLFGMLTQTVASTFITLFTSGTGIGMTAITMRWLDLHVGIELIVDVMVGLLALYAIVQVLTGAIPD